MDGGGGGGGGDGGVAGGGGGGRGDGVGVGGGDIGYLRFLPRGYCVVLLRLRTAKTHGFSPFTAGKYKCQTNSK